MGLLSLSKSLITKIKRWCETVKLNKKKEYQTAKKAVEQDMMRLDRLCRENEECKIQLIDLYKRILKVNEVILYIPDDNKLIEAVCDGKKLPCVDSTFTEDTFHTKMISESEFKVELTNKQKYKSNKKLYYRLIENEIDKIQEKHKDE